MAKELQQGRITVEILFETYGSNYSRTENYVLSSGKGCVKSGKNGNFHVEVFDRNGHSRGGDSTGDPYEPSPELLALIESVRAEYSDADDPPGAASA